MTLAQSSHVIPIPTAATPARKPTSKVFLSRRKPAPVPSLAPSKEASHSPRRVASEVGKVAKAVQHFTARAGQETRTSRQPLDLREGSSADLKTTTLGTSPSAAASSALESAMECGIPGRTHLTEEPSSASEPCSFDSWRASARSDTAIAEPSMTENEETFADPAKTVASNQPKERTHKSLDLTLEGTLANSTRPESQPEQTPSVEGQVPFLLKTPSSSGLPAIQAEYNVQSPPCPAPSDLCCIHLPDLSANATDYGNTLPTASVLSDIEHGQNSTPDVRKECGASIATLEGLAELSHDLEGWIHKRAAMVKAPSIMPQSDRTFDKQLDTMVSHVILERKAGSSDNASVGFLNWSVPVSVEANAAPATQAVRSRGREEQEYPASRLSNMDVEQDVHNTDIQHFVTASPAIAYDMASALEGAAHPLSAQSSSYSSLHSSDPNSHPSNPAMKAARAPESTHHMSRTAPDVALCSPQSCQNETGIAQKQEVRADKIAGESPALRNMDRLSVSPAKGSARSEDDKSFWVVELLEDAYSAEEPPNSQVTSQASLHPEIEDPQSVQEQTWFAASKHTRDNGSDGAGGNYTPLQVAKSTRSGLSQTSGSDQLSGMPQKPSMSVEELLFELIEDVDAPASTSDNLRPRTSLIERTASWIKRTLDERDSTPIASLDDQDDYETDSIIAGSALSELIDNSIQAEAAERLEIAEPSFACNVHNGTSPGEALEGSAFAGASLEQPSVFVNPDAAMVDRESNDIGRGSKGQPSQDYNTARSHAAEKARSQDIGRSYSQRVQLIKSAAKPAKRIPGRIKIPQRHEEIGVRTRRQSLEQLSARKLTAVRASQQSGFSHTEIVSPQGNAATRSRHFGDMQYSWLAPENLSSQTTTPSSPSSPTKYSVQRMINHWDESPLSREVEGDEEEEVASIAVGKRMTLRRMSDFTFRSTPGGEAPPLLGKLRQRAVGTIPAHGPQKPFCTTRKIPSMLGKQPLQPRAKAEKQLLQKTSQSSLPGYDLLGGRTEDRASALLPDTPLPITAQPRPQGTEDSTHAEQSLTNLSSTDDICKPEEVLSPLQSAERKHNVHQRVDRSMRSGNTTTTPRAQHRALKPLRLQGSHSIVSTSKRPDVSITNTSPRTVLSELWTPETSNPTDTAVTDLTGMSRSVVSSTHSPLQSRVGRQLADDPQRLAFSEAQYQQVRSCESHRQQAPKSRNDGHLCACRHKLSQCVLVGSDPLSVGPSSGRAAQETGLKREDFHQGQGSTASTNVHASALPMPGFELSFQLQEPKLTPCCADGTLFELGLRVLIKPSEERSVHTSEQPRLPSRRDQDARLRNLQRDDSHVDASQYVYSNLSPAEMSRVQEEAQEHLRHAFTSPQARVRRNASSSSRLSPFRSNSAHSVKGLSSPFSGADKVGALCAASSGPSGADTTLTGPHLSSPSRSSVNTRVVSSAIYPTHARSPMHRWSPSTALGSPLPYIKRAPPRTRTISSTVSARSFS